MRLGMLLPAGPGGVPLGPAGIAEGARRLEGIGFDSAWVFDSIGRGFILPDPLIALSVAFGVATVCFVILNEQNSPRLARLHSWPAATRTAFALALCAAVGFTISIPLALVGVTGIWAVALGAPLLFANLCWRDVRDWWRLR